MRSAEAQVYDIGPGPKGPGQVANTAGETEREARSRQWNLMEALGIMALLLGTLWFVAYPLGVLMGLHAAGVASRWIIVTLLSYALVVSPFLHRDTAPSRGLGNPFELPRILRGATPIGRFLVLSLAAAIIGALTVELYGEATGADRLVLGIAPDLSLHLERRFGGKPTVLLVCFLISVVWATCIVRYDNLWPSLKVAGKIIGFLLPVALVVAWVANGPEAFSVSNPRRLVLGGMGYAFWAATQQLVFCSYFGTRLRKAVAPPVRPRTYAWKRAGVALLNGLFFGLVHMNNWLLVGFAWILGSFLSWFFMEDRYRNVQALGLAHGVLGTVVLWLFANPHRPVHIRLRIGPWALRHHWDPASMTISGLLLLLTFALFWVGYAQRQKHRNA